MSNWTVTCASIIGSSHLSHGGEKQDSIAVVEDKNGNVAFCLSDGAGSSKKSKLSSSFTSQFIAERLSELPSMIEQKGTGSWINDYIIQCVIDLRAFLFEEFSTYDLVDYHCTLVSGVLFDKTCLVAHIGDGAVLSGTSVTKNNECLLNKKLYFSEPENGEYINETYFLTEPHWLKHLRVKAFSNVSWLIAGTDGGIDLLSVGDHLQDQLVLELLSKFANFPSPERDQSLERIMSSPKADEKTNDDKTLLIITSSEISKSNNQYWQTDNDTITNFYPEIQKQNNVSNISDPTPSVVVQNGHTSEKVLENENITRNSMRKAIQRVYSRFNNQIFLTIVVFLIFVILMYSIVNFTLGQLHGPQNAIEVIHNPALKENSHREAEERLVNGEGPTNVAKLTIEHALKINTDVAADSVEIEPSESSIEKEELTKKELSDVGHELENLSVEKVGSSEETRIDKLIESIKNIFERFIPKSSSLNNPLLIDGSNATQKNSEKRDIGEN
jgi:hypothetical protein